MAYKFKMLKARYLFYSLQFKRPAGTSRGVLHQKNSWFIQIWKADHPEFRGIGEVSIISNLSIDTEIDIPKELDELCQHINEYKSWITTNGAQFPAIRFGLETALADLNKSGNQIFHQNEFTNGEAGIPINGLIWMGSTEFMRDQIQEKIDSGFNCIKIKIGAIDFEEELKLIRNLRKQFSPQTIEIRLDANGAFNAAEALHKLERLSAFGIHSVEQPIKAGQTEIMAKLCQKTPIPIALDEELIGIQSARIAELLDSINPQYIILKPSLIGGFTVADSWISAAENRQIAWWATSALESNIGLNAIAQWVSEKKTKMPQGLGTGQLYTNNISSPLEIKKAALYYNPALPWQNPFD